MFPLISATDAWTLWAVIAAGTVFSIWLEKRYRWADRLSAPVIALLIAMALSNTGVMPASAPAYDFIGDWLVPLALPLLLMQGNVVRIAREAGRLVLGVFLCASGTLVGAFIAAGALREFDILEMDKAAAIMTGSYIGGGVNFAAIATGTRASGDLTGALIVADNLVMAGFFLALLWIAGSRFFLSRYPHPHAAADGAPAKAVESKPAVLTVNGLGAALAYAFGAVALAMGIGKLTGGFFPAEVRPGSFQQFLQTLVTNKFVLITAVSMAAATLFPRALTRLHGYEQTGAYFLYLFLFSIGLPANFATLAGNSSVLFLLCAIMAVTNLLSGLVLGKVFKLSIEEIVLSVNATLGGPPTAAAMAVSRGWSALVLPALLAGLLGYIIGTPLGLMVYTALMQR